MSSLDSPNEEAGARLADGNPSFSVRETFVMGLVLAALGAVANVFLGLYAGLSLAISLPATLAALAGLRWLLHRGASREVALVQAMAASGAALGIAVSLVLPALLVANLWITVPFWPALVLCLSGGVLGTLFALPFSGAHAAEGHAFPEAEACRQILESSERSRGPLFAGLGLAAVFKAGASLLGVFRSSVEGAWVLGKLPLYAGADLSPALLGVGYLAGLPTTVTVLAGGLVTWVLLVPFGADGGDFARDPLGWFWLLWNTQWRYLGVGALAVAALWSGYRDRGAPREGLRRLLAKAEGRNLRLVLVAGSALLFFSVVYGQLGYLLGSALSTALMVALALLFTSLASRFAGRLGTSLVPVSAMTLLTLLVAGLSFRGGAAEPAMAASLFVALAVAIAVTTGAVLSQNLRIGAGTGASEKSVAAASLAGIAVASLWIVPVLRSLHYAYGIGTGQRGSLTPSQANLFAGLSRTLAAGQEIPWMVLGLGALIALAVLVLDEALRVRRVKWRISVVALAAGMYLPLSLSLPFFLGGLIGRRAAGGKAFATGLIAGEALIGVLLGFLVFFRRGGVTPVLFDSVAVSLGAFALVAAALWAAGRKSRPA